jgi:MATE family multidrug resistance protein
MAVVLMLHGLAMIQAGAVRGLGMLELATWMVLIAFYFVALPSAYLFAFPLDMGMLGLWWGVVAGSIAEIILYVIIL